MPDEKQDPKTTRREFLKSAAVVGTGVLTGVSIPLTQTETAKAAAADWPPPWAMSNAM